VATTTTKESNEKNEKSAAGSEMTLTKRLDNTGGGGLDVADHHDNDDDVKTTATVADTAVAPKKKIINDGAAAPEAIEGSKNSSGEDVGGDDDNDDDRAATTATTTKKKRTKKKRKNDDVSAEDDLKVNSDSPAAPEVKGGSKNSSGEDAGGDDDNDDDQAATTATTTKKKRKNDAVSDADDRNMNGDPEAAPTGTGGSNSSGNVETRRESARLKGSAGTSVGDNERNNDNDDDAEPSSNGNDVVEGRKDDANSTTTVCCANDKCVLNSETIDDAAATCNNCSGKAHGECVQDWDNGQLAKNWLTDAGKRVFVEIQIGDTSSHKICLPCFERAKKKQKESKRLKATPTTQQKKFTQSQIVDGTNIKKGPKDATSLPSSLPANDEDSNETAVKSKRDGKSLARFSLNDTWRSNAFQYDSMTKSNRKSKAKANILDWTQSFNPEKNQHHTVVPDDECFLDGNKTVYFNVGNDQVCKGNEYPLHTTTAADNQCENMLTFLTERSDALRRNLPKSELRGVDIRRNSSYEPATLFIHSAVDCIEMVDHIEQTKDVGKVFLHPNIMRTPKFFQMCIQQIPAWINEKDTEGVYFLGFVRMWVKDDVVIKFFIDAGLLFSVDASQDDGLMRVNIHREHTHPVFCGSGMVKRLIQIAMLGFGLDAMKVEGKNVLVTPDTCKAIAGRLEFSEGPNGSSRPSKKMVDDTTKITTTVVLSLPEVLDSPFKSPCTTTSPHDLTDAHVATLTAIPFSVIVHALRLKVKSTTSAIDANITETLCEIDQWTEVCPLGYSKLKPFHLECRLRCRCCEEFFGQKSSLFSLLHSAPELIANHHGVTGVSLPGFGRVSQSSCVDENKCRFGNGLFQPGQNNNSKNCEDVLLDITKRRNLADAIRTDRLNCKNTMMETCILFNLLHKDIPDQGKDIHTNNVIEMEPYNVTNINNHKQWKQNGSLTKKAAIAFWLQAKQYSSLYI
jgi:hypothetical protein